MSIDPMTGLPELPDGQWWEVRPSIRQYASTFTPTHTMTDGYEVCLMKNQTHPAHVIQPAGLFRAEKIQPERVTPFAVRTWRITGPVKLSALDRRTSTNGGGWPRVGKEDITADDVLNAAKAILDAIDADAKKNTQRAVSAALVGVYPPKKLVTS